MSKCGTTAGYKAHRRNSEPPCQACKDAIWAYQQSRTTTEERAAYAAEYYERTRGDRPRRGKRTGLSKAEWNARWAELNREKVRAYGRAWLARHPEYRRLAEHRRRAAKVGAPYTEAEVLARYGTNCHICGEAIDLDAPRQIGRDGWRRGLHIDHLRAISRGGEDSLDNVRPAHGECNIRKGCK